MAEAFIAALKVGALAFAVMFLFALVRYVIDRANLRRRHYSGVVSHNLRTGEVKPVEETEGGKLFRMIAKPRCPDCGSTAGFYEGPSGGISTNVFCANRECRSGFNITPWVGTADRIGKGDLARYPENP